jgi:UDP-N-acetyl-D-mannosaminuronic acid dehydrogenase
MSALNGFAATDSPRDYDIVIVGGLGHVGLPLGIVLADKGFRVCLYDMNVANFAKVRQGEMPFVEYGAEPILRRVIGQHLFVSDEPKVLANARVIIVAIGTPVDEYLNPKLRAFLSLFDGLRPHLNPCQTIIIRSTVSPGTCQQVERLLATPQTPTWHIAYCPERIAQGYAIQELEQLPQIVSGLTPHAVDTAAEVFGAVTSRVIRVDIAEAELVKLFSNAWRYIQFAVANEFYTIASELGTDFNRVRAAMVDGYGRAANLPTPGFAAGPCLLKDTMQLASVHHHRFLLGHAAMMTNEGLPNFVVDQLARRYDLSTTRVGILGMAFKANVDDIRDSLSYKLGKLLRSAGADVSYSDEFAQDPTFISKEQLLAQNEVVIVGTPHSAYRDLAPPPGVEIIDLWGIMPGAVAHVPPRRLSSARRPAPLPLAAKRRKRRKTMDKLAS